MVDHNLVDFFIMVEFHLEWRFSLVTVLISTVFLFKCFTSPLLYFSINLLVNCFTFLLFTFQPFYLLTVFLQFCLNTFGLFHFYSNTYFCFTVFLLCCSTFIQFYNCIVLLFDYFIFQFSPT